MFFSAISGIWGIVLSSCIFDNFKEIAKVRKRANLTLKNEYKTNPPKAVMIATSSYLLDGTFNHSAYQGMRDFFQQVGLGINKAIGLTLDEGKQNYQSLYRTALNNDFLVWILPGFQHAFQLPLFIANNKGTVNEEKLKKVHFIGIDYDLNLGNDPQDAEYKKHFHGYKFNVEQPSFAVGYAAAKFLSETVPDQKKRNISTFGGAPFPAVTDFILGFLKGILTFNLSTQPPTKRVGIVNDNIPLNSGFSLGSTMNAAVTNATASNVSMVFPVAGPATDVAVQQLKKNQLIIGVDVDKSLNYTGSKKALFFTSVLKNIAQATYDALANFYTDSKPNNNSGKSENLIVGNFQMDLVGVADTQIKTKQANIQKAKQAIEEGKDYLKKGSQCN